MSSEHGAVVLKIGKEVVSGEPQLEFHELTRQCQAEPGATGWSLHTSLILAPPPVVILLQKDKFAAWTLGNEFHIRKR